MGLEWPVYAKTWKENIIFSSLHNVIIMIQYIKIKGSFRGPKWRMPKVARYMLFSTVVFIHYANFAG